MVQTRRSTRHWAVLLRLCEPQGQEAATLLGGEHPADNTAIALAAARAQVLESSRHFVDEADHLGRRALTAATAISGMLSRIRKASAGGSDALNGSAAGRALTIGHKAFNRGIL